MRSFFQLTSSFPNSLVLLALFASSHPAFCNQGGAASQDLRNKKTWYQTETTIAMSPDGAYVMRAGANTIIAFDDKGTPAIIAFVKDKKIGGYGIDSTGHPDNKGRLIYKGKAMPFIVYGKDNTYLYHLKYLELTTVQEDPHKVRAYATKAIASDNKVEASVGGITTYELPPDGQVTIVSGNMRIGSNEINPHYDLTGDLAALQPSTETRVSAADQPSTRPQANDIASHSTGRKIVPRWVVTTLVGVVILVVIVAGTAIFKRRVGAGSGSSASDGSDA